MARLELACPACARLHSFADLVPFRAECEGCAADLHVCITCRFHDRYAENECREDAADPVAKKDRANLCEYWKPRSAAESDDDPAALAKAKLAAMFGGNAPAATTPTHAPSTTAAADEAKRKLDERFKKK